MQVDVISRLLALNGFQEMQHNHTRKCAIA